MRRQSRRLKKKKASRAQKKESYECYHCKKWLTEKERKTHDCWSTTEHALTRALAPELLDAWVKLREVAVDLGNQRIYTSQRSIMFSKKSCYFFVRPMKTRLELCFFAGRKIKHSDIRKIHPTTKTKFAHLYFVTHGDQIESPLTDWLKEAYDFCPAQKPQGTPSPKKVALQTRKSLTFEELNRK